MLRWAAQRFADSVEQPGLVGIYDDLRQYLPLRRRMQFLQSWVLEHQVLGKRRRDEILRREGRVVPAMVNVSATYRCNLHCRGCYASAYDRRHEMTFEQFAWIVDQADALGVTFVGLLGGEPLLRKDLLPILEQHPRMAFRISTSGTLVDDEIVAFLRRSGNTVLFFSLEGLEQGTDDWRGKGVYRKVREAMDRLRVERVLFGFSAVLHAQNHELITSEVFLDEMRDAGARIGLFFPYGPVGGRQLFDFVLTDEEVARAYDRIRTLEPRYRMVFGMEDEPTCTAGTTVHITPEGNVEPCNGIQFHSANIFEKGLRGVLADPFYREIAACAAGCHRCVGIHHPEQLIQIVRKSGAKESNVRSLQSLCRYVDHRRRGGWPGPFPSKEATP